MPLGYDDFFHEEEPAPHIHFYSDAISEEYRTRNGLEGKEKNINGNAISLEHLFDYFCTLAMIDVKVENKEELTEKEISISQNDFGMPYLEFIKSGKIDRYKSNADATKRALISSFNEPYVKNKVRSVP